MIREIRRLFRKLTPLEIASSELFVAELEKLEAQTAQEYAESVVSYNSARIRRLKAFITAQTKEETT